MSQALDLEISTADNKENISKCNQNENGVKAENTFEQIKIETDTKQGLKSYLQLLNNQVYRNFYISSAISAFGDFFTEIACFTLLNLYWDSAYAVGLFLTVRELPSIVLSPFNGVIADNFDRRKVIFTVEILRAIIVLGFILTEYLRSTVLLFLFAFLQLSAGTFAGVSFQGLVNSMTPFHSFVRHFNVKIKIISCRQPKFYKTRSCYSLRVYFGGQHGLHYI